ncbi:hypothetical protein, partial [Rhodococcus pyridinivorans]|uniref:hypothetical protein n=1 Tax=Rhodococcus pyridinivorans TaxID=103816 RepID=UPI00265A4504
MQLTAQPVLLRPQLSPLSPQPIESFSQCGDTLAVGLDATLETTFLRNRQSFFRCIQALGKFAPQQLQGRSPRDVDTNTYAAEAIIVDLCSNS